jgi:hypothetical protein
MMIDSLYTKYFQKSRCFLFPILGIKKSSNFSPSGIYISVEGVVQPEDLKLVCAYKTDVSEGFKIFEKTMLLDNPHFEKVLKIRDYNIYVFDFQKHSQDWFQFIMGKYSKLSSMTKRAIKTHYGENSSEYKYVDSWLYPEKYYDVYAKLLDVDVSTLKSIGELCDPCDLEKETLKIPVEDLEILQKTT